MREYLRKRRLDPIFREGLNAKAKEKYIQLKKEIFVKLNNKCIRCGFSDVRALQIDHVHGGGYKERKETCRSMGLTPTYLRKIIISLDKNEGKYQLLCANCNWIKRFGNPNENPH